jgi:hypothetical protein
MGIGTKAGVTAIATAAMATSTLPRYGVSALGSVLAEELGLSRPQHGSLVAVTIGAGTLALTALTGLPFRRDRRAG